MVQMTGKALEIVNDGLISLLLGSSDPYIILMKTDFNGNIIWSKSGYILNGTAGWFNAKIHQTHDSGFIITIGYQIGYGPGYVWRTDSIGYPIWASEIYNNTIDAIETIDNGAFILGNGPCYGVTIPDTRDFGNPGAGQIGIVKTDSFGNESFCTGLSWGGFGTADTLVVTNFTVNSTPIGPASHFNTSISSPSISEQIGCVTFTGGITESSDGHLFSISPNPAHDVLNVECNLPNSELKIYDVMGKIEMEQQIRNPKSEIRINLPAGVYFVRVASRASATAVQKLVIE